MKQHWHDLTFVHAKADPDHLKSLLPLGVELDTFEGEAYVGIVAFWMSEVVGLTFNETNLRTYVRRGNERGVYFFSLEADNTVACRWANRFYSLPYHSSEMSIDRVGNQILYSHRRREKEPPASVQLAVAIDGEVFTAKPGTLEEFLVERYVLFVRHRGRLCSVRVSHAPYPLKRAELVHLEESLTQAKQVQCGAFDHVLASLGVQTHVGRLTRLE